MATANDDSKADRMLSAGAARPQSVGCDPSQPRPDGGDHRSFIEDGVDLLSYRKAGNVRPLTSNDRWHSDTNIALNPDQNGSFLTVDKTCYDITDSSGICIHWDIKEPVSAKDWIGLYKYEETHPGKWLDYRNRGVSGTKKGELVWKCDRIASVFTEAETRVCFRYYHGNTGDLRAVTDSIIIKNPDHLSYKVKRQMSVSSDSEIIHLAISDIEAMHVRKGMFFNPDPYVKISIEPGTKEALPVLAHHYKETRTSVCENTTEPRWTSEVFHFMALPTDSLFMIMKDRFTTSRPTLLRFLGLISMPIKTVVERARQGLRITCNLMGRSPHDHVCGAVTFKPTIIPYMDGKSVIANGQDSNARLSRSRSKIGTAIERRLERVTSGLDSDSTLSSGDDDEDQAIQAERSQGEVSYSSSPDISSLEAGMSQHASVEGLSHTEQPAVIETASGSSRPGAGDVNSNSDPLAVLTTASALSVPPGPVMFTLDCSRDEPELSALAGAPGDSTFTADSPEETLHSSTISRRSSSPDALLAYEQEAVNSSVAGEQSPLSGCEVGVFEESKSPTSASDAAQSDDTLRARLTAPTTDEVRSSPSAWSMENHDGSGSGSPVTFSSVGENMSSNAAARPLEDEMAYYLNVDGMIKPGPAASEPDASASEKRKPLPTPRGKALTLSEQLGKLGVIESAVAPAFVKTPEIPFKSKGAHLKETHSSAAGTSSQKDTPADLHTGQIDPLSGLTEMKRPLVNLAGSIDMPSQVAPPLPAAVRPKIKKAQLEQVAEIYMPIDFTDGKRKRADVSGNSAEPPPVLPPRKPGVPVRLLPEPGAPPQLPPRNVIHKHGKHEENPELDDVFEPGRKEAGAVHTQHVPVASHGSRLGEASVQSATARNEVRPPTPASSASSHHTPAAQLTKTEAIEAEEALPPGWEARVDAHGRVFYIDHANRVTTWIRPTASNKRTIQRVPSISNADKQNLDHRYRIIQRIASQDLLSERHLSPPRHQAPPPPVVGKKPGGGTIAVQSVVSSSQLTGTTATAATAATASTASTSARADDPSPGYEAGDPVAVPQPQGNVTDGATGSQESRNAVPKPAGIKDQALLNAPAIKFLSRTDFFSQVQYSDEAQIAYTSNSTLKHMVHKIRKDPTNFLKYIHNKDLVSFLNIFASPDEELPQGWEMKSDKNGKRFYIDHTTKTTTFIDPRLPIVQPQINPVAAVPLPRGRYRDEGGSNESSADLVPTAYNEKVVAFLRQPNAIALLQERCPSLKKNDVLRTKLTIIIADGTAALRKFRNNIELTLLLSMFENEIMSFVPPHLRNVQQDMTSPHQSPVLGIRHIAPPYKRDFQEKYRTFLRKLEVKGIGQGPGKIKMRVRRDNILQDSYKKVMSYNKRDLQRSKLLISFLGEEGLDYGGPAREFFFLLSRELFNPYYGLFEYSANDTYTVQISPMSAFVDDAPEWFRFAGRMLGLCIVHQYLMDSFFTRPFYKMLLREPCVLSDLESLDAEFHQSLMWIKDNDISEAGLDLMFSVDEEVFGQIVERELKPNGKEIPVTNKNKKEYIDKMVSWRIDRGINEQKDYLIRGFYEVLEPKLISIFDAKDLELVIAGTAEIDVADWRSNTEYRSGYYDSHPVIVWFWNVIDIFDNEYRLRLLQFVTGTSSIPFEGFQALRGSNGPRKFTIEKWGNPESLPRAHTCFNRLDLPAYPSMEVLKDKMLLAISETSTFGIE